MRKIYSFIVLILLITVNITPVTSLAGAQLDDWSADTRLTFTVERSNNPSIAVEGNNVHVVYQEASGRLDYHIWYVKSNDGGSTWNLPICLVNGTPMRASGPRIAVYRNNIHVIWVNSYDKNIHYMLSIDNGNTWPSESVIPVIVSLAYDSWDIGVCENLLHITYIGHDKMLYYIKSNDNGNTWESPIQLFPTIHSSLFSAVEVNNNIIHVACDGKGPGNTIFDTYYIRSEDNGETWGQAINITKSLASHYLDLGIYEDNIYVVYRANYNWQIFLSSSQDNGNNWTRNIQISNSPGPIFNPKITSIKNGIFIVWEDYRDGPPRIYFKNSMDGGNNWNNETEITNTYSNWPDIFTDENKLYFTWDDRRNGNEEIYFKTQNITIPEINTSIDIDPDTLNLKSNGRWITAYIELNEYYDVNDINLSSVLLENSIPAEYHPSEIGDYDNDGIPDLMVKFDRSEVEDILLPGDGILLTITGKLTDGTPFQGQDIMRAI